MRGAGLLTSASLLLTLNFASAAGAQESESEAASEWAAPSGTYVTDPKHRYISFSYDHQGYSQPIVRWGDWSAELDWDADDPTESSVMATIEAASVDSGVAEFNEHLKSGDFFKVAAYPQITFESKSLTKTGEDTGTMTGDLTIKDITKPVTLDVTINKAGETRDGGHKLGFSATGEVKRSDFGVDMFAPVVGDEVTIRIEAEFVPQTATQQ